MGLDEDWLDHEAAEDHDEHTGSALQRQFRNLGFREGLNTQYEQTLQSGFNLGFKEGYAVGWEDSRLLGAVRALMDVVSSSLTSSNSANGAAPKGARACTSNRFRLGKDGDDLAKIASQLEGIAHAIELRLVRLMEPEAAQEVAAGTGECSTGEDSGPSAAFDGATPTRPDESSAAQLEGREDPQDYVLKALSPSHTYDPCAIESVEARVNRIEQDQEAFREILTQLGIQTELLIPLLD